MPCGTSAKPDAVLQREAAGFKAAFEKDIDDCVDFFKSETCRWAYEREPLSTEFLEEKDDTVLGIGNIFDDLEKRWIGMISKMKENFLNSVEVFFSGATPDVTNPTLQPTELPTEKFSLPFIEEESIGFISSPEPDKGMSSPHMPANQKAGRPSEHPESEVDSETSAAQDVSSPSKSIEMRHSEIPNGNLVSSNKELNADDAGTGEGKDISGTDAESPRYVDEIIEALHAAIEKCDESVFDVNKAVDTYSSSGSSEFDEDDESIKLNDVPTTDNDKDQKNGTDSASTEIPGTSDQRKSLLELVDTESSNVVVAEKTKSILKERESIKSDEVPSTDNNEDQRNGTDSASSGILETSDQRKSLLDLAVTESSNMVVAEKTKSTLKERKSIKSDEVPATDNNEEQRNGTDSASSGMQETSDQRKSLVEFADTESSNVVVAEKNKSTLNERERIKLDEVPATDNNEYQRNGTDSASFGILDTSDLRKSLVELADTESSNVVVSEKSRSTLIERESIKLNEVPATDNNEDQRNETSSAMMETLDQIINLVELADTESSNVVVAEKTESTLNASESIKLNEVLVTDNEEDKKNGTDSASSVILETSNQRKNLVKLADTESPNVVIAEKNTSLNERKTRSHNTRKRKTYDNRDGDLRARVRNKSAVKNTKQKLTLLDLLQDESVSKTKKQECLMENVGDIHCSMINQEVLEDKVSEEYLASVIEWANELLEDEDIVVFLQQVCTHIGSWHKTNLLQALLETIHNKAYFTDVVEKAFTHILRYHNEPYDFKNCRRWGISGHGSGKGKVIIWSNRDSLQLLWRKMNDSQRRSLTDVLKKYDVMVKFEELGDLTQGKLEVCAECCNYKDFDENICNNSK